MKHLDLLNEFRTALSQLATEVEAASAMQMYDINKVCENLMLGVSREIYGWRDLRNLNAEEKANFPGIDLADDNAGVAIQVTATSNLDKVKDTIKTFLEHGLDKKYQRLIIYVLGRRQGSYSQDAIDRATVGRVKLNATDDILDYRDLCGAAAKVGPKQLAAALEVVREYMRGGVARGLSEEDFDPPDSLPQRVNLNLIEISFPSTLYIADLRLDIGPSKGRSGRGGRKMVREALQAFDLRPPSDFEVSSRQLITFHPLDDAHGPFANVIELGTVTHLRPREFYGLDEDRALRRACERNEIPQRGVKLDGLISELRKAEVFNDVMATRARTAALVRTKATHAQWDEFSASDVRHTLDFIQELLKSHLSV